MMKTSLYSIFGWRTLCFSKSILKYSIKMLKQFLGMKFNEMERENSETMPHCDRSIDDLLFLSCNLTKDN